jgi:predicted XRE-type DNA-binding protein
MKKRSLKQVDAAEIFGVRQPDVSKCCAGNFGNSRSNAYCDSWWRGQDVEIVVKPDQGKKERATFHVS